MITDLAKLRILFPIEQANDLIYEWKNDRPVTSWDGNLYMVFLMEEFMDLVAYHKIKVRLYYHEANDTYMATMIKSSNIGGDIVWKDVAT